MLSAMRLWVLAGGLVNGKEQAVDISVPRLVVEEGATVLSYSGDEGKRTTAPGS